MNNKIKVLVVDDSALVRKLLTEIIDNDPDIEVVGTAQDPYIARKKIKQLKPDVITLDIEMPRMDGITFLRNLMRLHPMPVVMVSSLTKAGANLTMEALEIGALEYVSKPVIDIAHQLENYTEELIAKIKIAASVHIKKHHGASLRTLENKNTHKADIILNKSLNQHFTTTDAIVAIGASTGGTEAIKEILQQLTPATPGLVITQHISDGFSAAFAARLNNLCALNVCEATEGQQIMPGHAYIAPGNKHLLVEKNGARYQCTLSDGPAVNRHKPSVDVLFRSVAQTAGPNSVGIILTGMGQDGARGLKEIQDAGALTIAQDEKTSVIWGMPGSAVRIGAADNILPLQGIADRILSFTHNERRFGT